MLFIALAFLVFYRANLNLNLKVEFKYLVKTNTHIFS